MEQPDGCPSKTVRPPYSPCLQSCLSHNRPATLGDIFLAIDGPDMRGVSIAVGASDPKLLLVRIDPLPQLFADGESLQTGLALDADEIDGKPVAVAAAAAPAVKGAVARRLVAACDRLPVIVAECAGDAPA